MQHGNLNAALATSGFYNTVVTWPGMVRAVAGQFLAAHSSKDHKRMNSIPLHAIADGKILVEKDMPIL
jgi:hypothetical protein